MGYGKADDFFYLQGIERRAAKGIWKGFGINKYELNMLAGLAACLQVEGKRVISKELYFDWIGGNRRFNEKNWMYIRGLLNKGCLHRLTFKNVKPGTGNSLAISPYGIRVLELYYQAIEAIEREDKARKQKAGFRDLAVYVEDLPHGYTLRDAGRA
jgi:hypothetical protein